MKPVCLIAAGALFLAGCGGEEETPGTGASGATGASQETRGLAEIAEQLPLPPPVVDDPAFHEQLAFLIATNHRFWRETLDEIDVPYHPPDEYIAYDGRDGERGPDCGPWRPGIENAAYCWVRGESKYGLIAWDESGLVYPMQRQLGLGAAAFLLAHEHGHLVQDQLGILGKFRLPIEKELNADCLAGAYIGAYDDEVGLTRRDALSVLAGIDSLGDGQGVRWTTADAHGTGRQRAQAVSKGFDNGAQWCVSHMGPGFTR